jgi:voltage-gated potassium channel
MNRNPQVILEALLSVLIIVDLLAMSLMTLGFFVGIKTYSMISVGEFDLVISLLILLDFIFFRLRKKPANETKTEFLKRRWAYLIAIIPVTFISLNLFTLFDYTIILLFLGVLKIYAMIIVLKTTAKEIRKYPSKTKLDYATFILLLVIIFGSYIFLMVEKGVNPEVPNYESAIWYALVSMTTTGYGDIVPVTIIGRVIGVMLILSGMAYVSLVTATLAYSFIDVFRKEIAKFREKNTEESKSSQEKAVSIEDKIDKLQIQINEMNNKMDEMQSKLDESKNE